MTGAQDALPRQPHGRRVHEVVLDTRRVVVGTAAPGPGESLSGAAARLAESLVAAESGCPQGTVRVASLLPSGRPVASGRDGALPVSVSLTHERGLVAAAVARGTTVGVDIVDVAVPRPGLEYWSDGGGADGAIASPGMEWAAREAAFKAAALDASFRPRAVDILGDDDGFTWTCRDRWRTVRGVGRFLAEGRHLVAVACAVDAAEGGRECS